MTAADAPRSHGSFETYQLALRVGQIAIWEWDVSTDTATWSPAWEELLGTPVEDLGTSFDAGVELVHPEDRPALLRHADDLFNGAEERHLEYRLRHADGSWRWARGSGAMVRDEGGNPVRLVLAVVDVTDEHRRLEAANRRSELETAGHRAAAALTVAGAEDIEGCIVAALGRFAAIVGAERAALLMGSSRTGTVDQQFVWTSDGPAADVALEATTFPWMLTKMGTGRPVQIDRRDDLVDDARTVAEQLESLSLESLVMVPVVIDRAVLAVEFCSTQPLQWSDGADITLRAFADVCVQSLRRRAAEFELREAHSHLQHLVDRAPLTMWRLSADSDELTYLSSNTRDFLGVGAEVVRHDWFERVHPDDVEGAEAAVAEVRAGNEAQFEARFRHADGRWLPFEIVVRPEFAEDGSPAGAVGYSLDVTRRRETEEHLRRAQKLEAIGQLAGGVAHDFNNLLTVIHGYIELAERGDLSALGEAVTAAERARVLVERLLTFSRQRDIEPVPVDINAILRSMHRMVNLVGPGIDVELDLAADLPAVIADVGQLEQAVLNLTVNARDAMPSGGTLTLRTDLPDTLPDDIKGGPYVRLQVIDTGTGMTPEVAARAIDPFFTTKAEGHGTGLGLSTVHGAVTAVGGALRLDTAADVGTTFHLYLPVATTQAAAAHEVTSADANGEGDPSLILVVEDQPQIGDLVRNILERTGHRVLVAPDGRAALQACQDHDFDLLITDVAMPHMSGPQLVAALRETHPRLPVVYMSGYSGEALHADENARFLQKPFTIEQLTTLTAEALAEPTTETEPGR